MNRERWGTFSVTDHTLPHAFVAEALMYDRLTIPVPPKAGDDALDLWKKWEPDRPRSPKANSRHTRRIDDTCFLGKIAGRNFQNALQVSKAKPSGSHEV